MGLKDVKQDILQEAEQEAEEIIQEGEDQRDKIISEAEEQAEEIKEKKEKEIEEEKEALKKKAISNANMEAKKKKLAVKEQKIDEVFAEFRRSLKDLSKDEKSSFLESAKKSAEFEVGKVLGSSDFEGIVSDEFEEMDRDGVILVSEDGERRLDFTFDKIADDFKENQRKDVAEKLF